MDTDLIFALLVFVFWLASQVLGGRKKPRPAPHRTPPGDVEGTPPGAALPEREDDLERALEEIRRTLGGGMPEPVPEPVREPPARPLPPPTKPVKKTASPPLTKRIPPPRVDAPAPAAAAAAKRDDGDLRARLRRPAALREAVVLKEILGPPRSLRGPGR